MIGALEMLLGPDRLFEAGASNLRLNTLMEQSRKEQNEVGTRLSELFYCCCCYQASFLFSSVLPKIR